MREKYIKKLIFDMVTKIDNKEFIEMIYGFVKRLYDEIKAED